MIRRILNISIALLIMITAAWPLAPAAAYYFDGGNFNYGFTKLGTDYRKINNEEYDIVGQRTNFGVNDHIVVLTKLNDISNIDRFRYRHEVRNRNGGVVRSWDSPEYRPGGDSWKVNYTWHDFDRLPAGDYDMRVLVSINNGGFQEIDTQRFTVGDAYKNYDNSHYNYNDNYYNNNYNNYHNNNGECYGYNCAVNAGYYYPTYANSPQYELDWLKVGTQARNIGSWRWQLNSDKSSFTTGDRIVAMTALKNIRYTDQFQVKHEIYQGSRLVYSKISPIQYPHGAYWEGNYAWADFGTLPSGSYQVKSYVSVNGGSYSYLTAKTISVSGATNANYCRDNRCYPNYKEAYHYDWTYADYNVRQISTYNFTVDNPKTSFYTDERVMVLTKLTALSGIDTFRVKQELYRDNTMIKNLISTTRTPHYQYWDYNYTQADYGLLPAGSYSVKAYIQINDGSYRYLGSQSFTVKARYNYQYSYHPDSYNYNNDNNYNYNNYYSQPSYQYGGTQFSTNAGNYQNYPYSPYGTYAYYR